MDDFQPLARLQCPTCQRNGVFESVVMYRVNDSVIDELQCRNCGYTNAPDAFDEGEDE